MKQFLAPTDFSDCALNASHFAAGMANEMKAKITLLNVYHYPNPLQSLPVEIMVTTDELKSDTESALKLQRRKIAESKPWPVEIECLSRNGFSAQEINHVAEELNVELVVMGMSGGGFARETFVGSVATSVIEICRKPVLLVPRSSTFKAPVRLVFAIDGKNFSRLPGMEFFTDLVRTFQAHVHVVNVNHPKDLYDKDEIADRVEPLFSDLPHSYHFIESDRVDHAINRFVSENKADWTVLISHKHHFITKIFSISHTRHLAFHSTVPLLVFHEQS
ncbi:MAG: universal stress protein [Bacteroidetes bacterium]|nr:universal stress protein [Bacteroidota bacterium]